MDIPTYMANITTIRVHTVTLQRLKQYRMHPRDTMEDIIARLLDACAGEGKK